jgi:hypothetical protein
MTNDGITLESLTLKGLSDRVQALLRLKGVQMHPSLPEHAALSATLSTPRGIVIL